MPQLNYNGRKQGLPKRTSLDTQRGEVLEELERRMRFRSVSLLFCHLSSAPHTPCHGFFMIIYSTSLQGLFFLQCFLSQNMFSNKRQTITHKQEGKQTSSFILSEGKRQKRTKNILVIYMQSLFPPESAADFRDAGCLLRGMDYKSYSCGLSLLLLL